MDAQAESRNGCVRFGAFELNTETGELRKHGTRLRLQEQPLKLLLCLLESPGAMYTREDLIRKVWPEGTFVDFDRGLNAAVTRLRQVMGDSADSPRFVETVGRKGYRFIAPVEPIPAVTSAPPSEAARRGLSRAWLFALASGAAGIAMGASVMWWWTNRAAAKPLIRLTVELGPDSNSAAAGPGTLLALSPDGSRLALTVLGPGGQRLLATRRLDQSQVTSIPGTEGAGSPFFSPDGQWIGFFAGDKLKKIPAGGGMPVTLADAPTPTTGPRALFPTASWGDDGNIVAMLGPQADLFRVSSAGGVLAPLAGLKKHEKEMHRWPQVLPGSRGVLFTATRGEFESSIDAFDLKTGQRKTIHTGGLRGRYLASGHLAYIVDDNTLFAAPFDLGRLALTGPPRPVLDDVAGAFGRSMHFDASQSGSFVYVSARRPEERAIASVGRDGQATQLFQDARRLASPRFSPDGKRLAFSALTKGRQNIWVRDMDTGAASPVTALPGVNDGPIWTRDNQRIIFRSVNQPNPGLYGVPADGSAGAKLLLSSVGDEFPSSLSPDGKWLALRGPDASGGMAIARVELDGNGLRLGKLEQFPHAAFDPAVPSRSAPAFSPDGRWLAYSSNESGGSEVYATRFPGPGPKKRVSTNGGIFPVWSRNGRELLFHQPVSNRLMAAPYTANGDSLVLGEAKVWTGVWLMDLLRSASFDVAPDGEHVVVIQTPPSADLRPRLMFLLNFFDELRRSESVAQP
jgi:serine/threonine-protein kinase